MVEAIEKLPINKMKPKLEELLAYLKNVCNKDAETFIKKPENILIYNYITNPIYNIEQGTVLKKTKRVNIHKSSSSTRTFTSKKRNRSNYLIF